VDLAQRLLPAYIQLLVDVAAVTLHGAQATQEPYIPASGDASRLAATLAQPSVGLLLAGSAGFVTCYSLTPLGAAVVRALLDQVLTQLAQRQEAAATPVAPSSWQGRGGPYGRRS
jgi:hypothetical protein